ncbi:hypothetical protein GALL_436130 [mine drainage metagenome]|uniref:Uncharacterized protein n=1 Tax=mine drainage metagenome TaxID=410659 RepID=A0A1J5PTB2_9ZZZZ
MNVPQCPVQVALIAGFDVRHTAFVVAHADRCRQPGQCQFALALRQFGMDVPEGTTGAGKQHGKKQAKGAFQNKFHGV